MDHGLLLRKERERRGWSAAAVARRIGRSRGTISAIELGRNKGSEDVLLALCELYGLDPRTIGVLPPPAEPERSEAPDHPGVRELAADVSACQAHRVTLEELHELAGLFIKTTDGVPRTIETKSEALHYLTALRSGQEHR